MPALHRTGETTTTTQVEPFLVRQQRRSADSNEEKGLRGGEEVHARRQSRIVPVGRGKRGGTTHWFAWVHIGDVRFEFLHSPVMATVDGVVAVLLVGRPDDKGNRTVHDTLIHDSKPFVSSGEKRWREREREGGGGEIWTALSGERWLQSSWISLVVSRHASAAVTLLSGLTLLTCELQDASGHVVAPTHSWDPRGRRGNARLA